MRVDKRGMGMYPKSMRLDNDKNVHDQYAPWSGNLLSLSLWTATNRHNHTRLDTKTHRRQSGALGKWVILMDHHIWVLLGGLLGVTLVAVRRGSIVHLHIITALLLSLLIFLILAFTVLDIFAAGLRGSIIVCNWESSFVCSGHGGIFTLNGSGALSLNLFFLFLLLLFDAVLVPVRIEIGFGLIRGELGWGRLLGIPVKVSAAVA
jgi:hypothetical protein